jgi:site-specific recombinase XerD
LPCSLLGELTQARRLREGISHPHRVSVQMVNRAKWRESLRIPVEASPMATLLEMWLADLRANDHAPGTVRRYRSAIRSFFAWYSQEEQRSFTLECLSPITLIGYRNFLQRIQRRTTSTVNGHISALRAWCAWLTEEHHLEANPAKRIKLVGRQEASSREGLSGSHGKRKNLRI